MDNDNSFWKSQSRMSEEEEQVKEEQAQVKPHFFCLIGIHSWERYLDHKIEVRRCRRCARIDEYYKYYGGGDWKTVQAGQVEAWRLYQAEKHYRKLSPELRRHILGIRKNDIALSTYPGRKK